MTDSNAKGDRRERELVNRLDAAGFAVVRAPASGSATERELPDVLAGNGTVMYAFEGKSSSGDPIYLSKAEVYALAYFAGNFGAFPVLGARFDYAPWRFLLPWQCHRTPSGNYRIKEETAERDGVALDALASGPEAFTDG